MLSPILPNARFRGHDTEGIHGNRVDNHTASLILKCMLNYQDGLTATFHALADPGRRAMIERLCRGPASVSELAKPFKMSLPAVVQHIQILETSGLIRTEKIGRVRTCRIEPKALQAVEQWVNERRALWERRLDRLGTLLANTDDDIEKGKRK